MSLCDLRLARENNKDDHSSFRLHAAAETVRHHERSSFQRTMLHTSVLAALLGSNVLTLLMLTVEQLSDVQEVECKRRAGAYQ